MNIHKKKPQFFIFLERIYKKVTWLAASDIVSYPRRVKRVLFLFLLCLPIVSLASSLPEKRFWVTDGTVNAIVKAKASIYIGGDFNYVGPNTGPGASLNTSSARPNAADPIISGGKPNSVVYAVLADGEGGWYVGGNFTTVGTDPLTQSRLNLVHILSNSAINPKFNPAPNGIVRALSFSDDGNTLYVGGEFTSIGEQNRNRLAAVTLVDGKATNWNPSIDDGVVFNLLLDDDSDINNRIFIGGNFTSVNGNTNVSGITSLKTDENSGAITTGWLPSSSVNTGGTVYTMELDANRGKLYVGGEFTSIGNQPRNNIAALNPDTGVANSFDPDANTNTETDGDNEYGPVYSLSLNNDETRLYVSGAFFNIGGGTQNYVARLQTTDDTDNFDNSWTPTINNTVRSIFVDDSREKATDRVYIGGDFTNVGRQDRSYLIAFNNTGRQTGWFSNADGPVHTMALSANGQNIFSGGDYLSIGGTSRNNLAQIDDSTGAVLIWAPSINDGAIQAMALNDDETALYLGGDFTSINTTTRNHIAKLHLSKNDLYNWDPDMNAPVHAISLLNKSTPILDIVIDPNQPNTIYIATEFGIYKSINGANSWSEMNNGLSTLFVKDLVIDPTQSTTLYAATWGGGVFKSTDSGASWAVINSGLTQRDVSTVAITSDGSTVYAGTEGGNREGGLFHSKDGGATWVLRAFGNVRRIAPDPNKSNLLYMGTTNGLFRIEDSGEFATATDIIGTLVDKSILDIQIDPTPVADDTPSSIFIVTSGTIFFSDDDGEKWLRRDVGLPVRSVSRLSLDHSNPSILYAATTIRGVYKTTNSGEAWTRKVTGLDNEFVFSIATHPNNSSDVYAGTSSTLLYKSTNGADDWVEVHDNIPNDILFAGGTFSNTITHPDYLAAIDTTNNANDYFMDWNASSDNTVNDLLLSQDGGTLFVGGSFTTIGGQARNRIAALGTSNGIAFTDWSPSIDDGVVNALTLSNNQAVLYAGGSFTSAEASTRSRLVAFSTIDGLLLDWNPGASYTDTDPAPDPETNISDLLVSNFDNLVYASGTFTNIGGKSRNNIASLRTTVETNNATDWTPDPDTINTGRQTLVSSGQFLLVGGNFDAISDTTSPSFAAYLFTSPTAKADPIGRSFNSTQTITLSCEDKSETGCANIFFTTDENLSTATWEIYTNPITISIPTKLSFYAEDNEGTRNATQTETYTIDRNPPTVSAALPSGTYPITQTVPLTCNDGDTSDSSVSSCASVFFTTDGSTPSFTTTFNAKKNRLEYEKNGTSVLLRNFAPILITGTLKFVAVDNAGNSSEVMSEDYVIERGLGATGSLSIGGLFIFIIYLLMRRHLFRDHA